MSQSSDDLQRNGWKPRDLPGYIGLAGPLWTRHGPSGWAYALRADERHLNPAGVVHGGALATLLDHAISTLAWEQAGRLPCVTVQLDLQYLQPVLAGQLVVATAEVVHGSASLLFMRGRLTVGDGEAVSAQAVLKVMRAKAS